MNPFDFNFVWIPVFIPFIMAGKSFLDHQDVKMAIDALVGKRTIIFVIVALFFSMAVQFAIGK